MKLKKVLVFTILICLILSGCSKKSTTLDDSGTSDGTAGPNNDKGDNATQSSLSDYFLKDGSKAHFEGVGNEYAELDVNVFKPFKNYVVVYEDNGGVLVRYIYRIEEDNILIVNKATANNKEDFPSQEEMDAMQSMGVYLKRPFEKGAEFNGWTIIETDAPVETPYKNFDHALVIENKEKDIVNRKYFVEGIGEVKRESIMTMEGEEDFIVTSSLKAIDE